MQARAFFDVFSRVESVLNNFRTVSRDPSVRVAAVSAVDKELDSAKKLFCSLFTRRNALLPISLLPPEILTRVFHFLALDEPPFVGKQNLGWIRATHVCQHWRQVALDDSSLWARISGKPTKTLWIVEMLSRAKNAPLDIDIDLARAPSPIVGFLLPLRLSHTRKLCIRDLSTPDTVHLRTFYNQEAPALEHFELEASLTFPITLPDLGVTTLFKGQAPKLRTHSLSHVLTPWSPIPRGQLTQLKIVNDNEDDPALGNSKDLIDLLVNCPALEILTLDFCLSAQLTQFPHGQTVHLPRLSYLRLGGSTSRVTNLLKMLKLPSSTTFHLFCMSENDPSLDEHHLLHLVSAHFQSPAPVDFKSLSISTDLQASGLGVTTSTSLPTLKIRHSPASYDMYKDAELVLTFNGLDDFDHWRDFLEQVCKSLPLTNLEFMSIDSPGFEISEITNVNWVELFNRCTDVIGVQAIGYGAASLVRALTIPKLTTTRSGAKKRRRGNGDNTSMKSVTTSTAAPVHVASIFPKLKFLSLEDLDFRENEIPSGVLFDVVERGLQQRQMAPAVPLESLRISGSTISSKCASALEDLVQKFWWDGWDGKQQVFDPERGYLLYDSDGNYMDSVESDEDLFIGHGTGEVDRDSDGLENYSDE